MFLLAQKTPGLTPAEFLSSSSPTSPKPREGEEEWEKSNSYMMGYEPASDVLNEKMTIKDFELMKVVGKGSFGKVVRGGYFFYICFLRRTLDTQSHFHRPMMN